MAIQYKGVHIPTQTEINGTFDEIHFRSYPHRSYWKIEDCRWLVAMWNTNKGYHYEIVDFYQENP